MPHTPKQTQDEYADKFPEAANDWDLKRLYADLAKAKQNQPGSRNKKSLTSKEKACLRGLLCDKSPQEIAEEFMMDYTGIRVDLARGLYPFVKTLTKHEGEKLTNWRQIPKWLEEARYKQKPVSKPSNLYVERSPTESICYRKILQPATLIRIKAPQKMGKTLLMNNIFTHAAQKGYQKVLLNLLEFNEDLLTTLDKFLLSFCSRVGYQLKLPNKPADDWDEYLGASGNCKAYFEKYILSNIDKALVFGLDNVDHIFPYDKVAPDFFGLLRAWHEEGKRNEIWEKLRLVVAYSTEVNVRLDINQSPFNVGTQIDLPEFSLQQLQELAQRYELNLDIVKIKQLREMVGGHPYLVKQAFDYLKNHQNITLEQILATATTDAGLYRQHLRQLLLSIEQKPKLVDAMKKVVEANKPVRVEQNQAYKLESMGLVSWQGNEIKSRCELYRAYFKEHLGSNL
ncbi:MAG: hypothetical protein F6K10_07735 [Moorea sp. SIO2B7]|nr:hypothetical protein [Moorena sp. SIO2B7]